MVTLATFVGNGATVRNVAAAESRGRGAHAYLIAGPARVGKRSLALALATLVTCANPGDDAPCGTCPSCAAAARDAHPDIHVIERREERRTILVEQAQEVARIATIRPYQSDRKAVVIVDAESLEDRAANLLLKTIEEPSIDTRLFLTASDGERVLPTIRSRCRSIALRPVPAGEIAAALADRGIDGPHALLLARLANGRPGWAIDAADDPGVLTERNAHLRLLSQALAVRSTARLHLADQLDDARNLARAREVMGAAFATWTGWWRDAVTVRAGCPELMSNVDRSDEITAVARRLDLAAILAAVSRTRLAASHLDDNVNPRLALEGLLLDLPDATGA